MNLYRKTLNHSPTQQNHNRISLGRNKTQYEYILDTATIALKLRLTERSIGMQRHLTMLCTHQMMNDVRA